ncbi:MAG: hypothetical protein AAGK28_04400 [Pseudomonadota bacterium]
MRLLVLLLMLISPSLSFAGAWPREKGGVFLSFSTTTRPSPQTHATQVPELAHSAENSLYAEYGLSKRVTLGFDGMMTDKVSYGQALIFARVALGRLEAQNRYAASFAVGTFIDTVIDVDHLEAEQTTLTRLGLHYGRGLNTGWVGADIFATQEKSGTSLKLDATWGLKPWERWMFIAQLQAGQPAEGDSYTNFAPSVVWKMNKRMRIEVGLVQPLGGDGEAALKLGSWTEF